MINNLDYLLHCMSLASLPAYCNAFELLLQKSGNDSEAKGQQQMSVIDVLAYSKPAFPFWTDMSKIWQLKDFLSIHRIVNVSLLQAVLQADRASYWHKNDLPHPKSAI
mmetsp:Transcript_15938/g.24802  ORF Transcript_15938/g.24802 Transcript_15938/m.24802 type:complete len:108 (-) Transcript_15938:1063-1386(-)